MMPMEKFVVNRRAETLLKEFGLDARVDEFLRKSHSAYNERGSMFGSGYVFSNEVEARYREMKELGYFSREANGNGWRLDRLDKILWYLKTSKGSVREITKHGQKANLPPADGVEVLVDGGYYASLILSPEEFWKSFDFTSASQMHGAVGAMMFNRYCQKDMANVKELHEVQTLDRNEYPTTNMFGEAAEHRPLVIEITQVKRADSVRELGKRFGTGN
jgi:hypothetical protein